MRLLNSPLRPGFPLRTRHLLAGSVSLFLAWSSGIPGGGSLSAQEREGETTLSPEPKGSEEMIATAADDFPRKPIRLIVYTGAGGLVDLMSRKFADVARKYAPEQPIVVINRPGAGGIVAFEEVLQQPADGYHFLAVTRSNVTKLVSAGREDLLDEVDWFASLMSNPHVVITNRNSGLMSWEAVQKQAREREGRQLWLGVDIGGVKHVSGLEVWRETGIEARWIPFGSGGQAAAALLGEIGQVYFGNPADATGNPDLIPVAVCAEKRLEAFPDAPTFTELGVHGLENELIWRGFAFRKGTPAPVLTWYRDLIRKVDADEEWREQWRGEGIDVLYQPAEAFSERVQQDRELFREVLEPLGLLKKPGDSLWFGFLSPDTGVRIGNVLLLLLAAGFVYRLSRSGMKRVFGPVSLTTGAITVALSLLLMSILLPPPNAIDLVGAAGLPRLWATALLLLAAGQIAVLLWDFKIRATPDGDPAGDAPPLPDRLLPFVLIALAAYLFSMDLLGYLLATLLFFPLVLWGLGFRRRGPILALTAIWLAFAYFVFQRMLNVDLPSGWLAALGSVF